MFWFEIKTSSYQDDILAIGRNFHEKKFSRMIFSGKLLTLIRENVLREIMAIGTFAKISSVIPSVIHVFL